MEGSYTVKVHLYDISKGLARNLSQAFLGRQLDGIWHTGVVVYGKEFYFGGTGGIESCAISGTVLGPPNTVLDMGVTHIPYDVFLEYLSDLAASSYAPDQYHLLDHNCNNFSDDVSQFLTGRGIPSYITDLPSQFLNTPMGAMVKPLIDSMHLQPSGGTALFPPSGNHGHGSGALKPSSSSNKTSNHQTVAESKPAPAPASKSSHKPITFMPDTKSIQQYSPSDLKLPEHEGEVWKEVIQYVNSAECTYSLCGQHLQLLGQLLHKSDVSDETKLHVCEVLQVLVLKEDFMDVIPHDTKDTIHTILDHFDEQPPSIKTKLFKIMANCYSSKDSQQKMCKVSANTDHEKMEQRLTNECVTGLLDEVCPAVEEAAAMLAYNLSLYEDDRDREIQVASAVLHSLQKAPTSDECVCCSLSIIMRYMSCNSEVAALVGLMSIDWTQLATVSDEAKKLCNEITSGMNS